MHGCLLNDMFKYSYIEGIIINLKILLRQISNIIKIYLKYIYFTIMFIKISLSKNKKKYQTYSLILKKILINE